MGSAGPDLRAAKDADAALVRAGTVFVAHQQRRGGPGRLRRSTHGDSSVTYDGISLS